MSSISEEELEREVRTLKHLRRRSGTSAGPGELPVDPDLPPPDSFQHGSDQHQQYSSNDDVTLSLEGDAGLFWVPAHLHPELAPGEFRNFLKSHTVDPDAETTDTSEAGLARSPSWLARSRSMSGGLGRKKSMLSKQYQPRAGDNVEAERVPVRRGSLARGGGETGPSLRDLQKLEELVGDAEFADNPDKMREVLRRSLSQRMQPGLNETTQGDGETEIAMPAPPRPGSIIRRTARTKIRKGPNDGRRYSSTRRQRLTSPSQHTLDSSSMEDGGDRRSDERRSDETSEEASREGETFHDPSPIVAQPPPPVSDDNDEAMIFDAYARSSTSTMSSLTEAYDGSRSPSPDEHPPARERPTLTPIVTPKHGDSNWAEDQELTPTQEASMSAALHAVTLLPSTGTSNEDIFQSSPDSYADNYADAYASDEAYRAYLEEEEEEAEGPAPPAKLEGQQQQPARDQSLLPGMAPPLAQGTPPSMSTSGQQRVGPIPPALTVERPPLARTDSNSSTMSTASSTTSASAPLREKEKEKSKKGLFGKKHSKDKEKDKHKKEKDGFLGSLFGSKKKQEETSSVANFSTAGPAAAAALLGTSKSAKSLQASGTSSPTSPGFSNFARYPIHVERAVYRLSHIKLANARRPLIEQVLISNLMFWYLGVIGRAAGPAEDSKPGTVNGLDKDREEAQRSPPPKGTPPKSPDSGQFEDKSGHPRHQPQPESPSPSPTRKTGLVKPERSRVANNSEAAFRAPQYGMQNAQMEQEMRPGLKQPHPQQQQQQHPIHHAPPIPQSPSPPPQQQQQQPPQQQQHFQQAPAPTPRTSSMPSSPQRTLSPPAQSQQQPRQEYPPGVAPPRPQPFGPGVRPMPQGRPVSQHPPGAQPARPPQQPDVRPPPQQYPASSQPPNGSMRPDRPIYSPYNDGGSGGAGVGRSSSQQRGVAGQPGQVFQYPAQYARPGHHGPQPGQIFTAQPGQIFHHPQYQQQQQQQRPPGAAPAQGWESVQRLPPGQQQGPTLAQTPPRRTSSTSQSDPYGRQGYQREGGQTSPTHGGSFYSQQRPAGQYQYPPGQARPQPVPSGQYPHHR